MASLQRTISRAITVKGLNKKQKRRLLAEIRERKQRERREALKRGKDKC